MSKTTKWIVFSLAGIVVLLLLIKVASHKGLDGIKVTTETVKKRTVTETVSGSGQLYPETEIKISSPVYGEVTALNVKEGDTVVKGQVLAHIQADKTGASSQRISLPNLPPGLGNMLQSVQPARSASASSANLTAPMSGTVTMLGTRKGERVGSASELFRIADMNTLEVRIDVNENNIIKVAVGDSADVQLEAYNKRKFKGVVTLITNGSGRKDMASMMSGNIASFEVHVRLNPSSYTDLTDAANGRRTAFRSGMTARADIKTQKKEGVATVPVGAVTSRISGSDDTVDDKKTETGSDATRTDDTAVNSDELEEIVYVVKGDGTAEKRKITTGIQDINYFEVTGGLKEGEQVVTGPFTAVSKTVRTGKKLIVVSKTQLSENK